MLILVVDMTHGGVKIATEFSKMPTNNVFAWDIYNTLNNAQKLNLKESNIQLVGEDFLKDHISGTPEKEGLLKIVAPVHCKLKYPVHMTHHEAVGYLMKNRINIPVIEVTGVKGKTSVVHMLQNIFKDSNPLILSSLGVEIILNGERRLLKRNISITPASIIEAWDLARQYDDLGIFIFETSLGGSGLADVGILTNITEDYTIAGGSRKASWAKNQIFNSKMVVSDLHCFNKFYSVYEEKTNTFSIKEKGNVQALNVKYGLQQTNFQVKIQGLKTITGEILQDFFKISTFAPAPHHVQNVLSAIGASLTLGASLNMVINGIKDFKGLKGRTSINMQGNVCIIEEINPGINISTIKKALEMVKDLPHIAVVFGGRYGVTCEEISEDSVGEVFNKLDEKIPLILTDELGMGVKSLIKRDFNYIKTLESAVDAAIDKRCWNILLIYRSNYPDLKHR